MSKNIVIIGYPKSGTTWLTRLVADLLQCPLKGNWGFMDPDQPIIERLNRPADFACYKSHHTYEKIFDASEKSIYKIIYIFRDPRDIVISGANFFGQDYNIVGLRAFKKRLFNSLKNKSDSRKQIINAVLNGDELLDQWFSSSWTEHYQAYNNKNVLFVQYETLIDSPINQCTKILDYLSVQKTNDSIIKSIERQSFKNKKSQAAKIKDRFENHLLNRGSYGYWQNEFSLKEKKLFVELLGEDQLFKKRYLKQ